MTLQCIFLMNRQKHSTQSWIRESSSVAYRVIWKLFLNSVCNANENNYWIRVTLNNQIFPNNDLKKTVNVNFDGSDRNISKQWFKKDCKRKLWWIWSKASNLWFNNIFFFLFSQKRIIKFVVWKMELKLKPSCDFFKAMFA